MKILTSQQIREADQSTIAHEPVASEELMERAAGVFVKWFSEKFSKGYPVKIFCGIGNNGGDGLVIARLLHEKHFQVDTFIVRFSPTPSADFIFHEKKLRKLKSPITEIQEGDQFPALHHQEIVIDALWGSGLNRPIEGFAATLIEHLNQSEAIKVAVDIPTGLYADSQSDSIKFKANYTLSFETPKLSFFLPESHPYVGEFIVKSIGLHPDFLHQLKTNHFFITPEKIKSIYRIRQKFSHKGAFGHALIYSGSYGKMGAATLCAEACLRAGAGLVSVFIPKCGYSILQTAIPECMVLTDAKKDELSEVPDLSVFKVAGAGPGIGMKTSTSKAIHQLITTAEYPIVLDADALNIIAENKIWLNQIPAHSILTPHPKEFERLFGKSGNDFERLKLQSDAAQKFNLFIVMKTAHTIIATPEGEIWFNTTGNPGMATAGAGDVLTGIITGLLSQGYTPFESALFGVYWHGLAGDYAADELTQPVITARDIIQHLGKSLKKLLQ